jgi:hypothetical protein
MVPDFVTVGDEGKEPMNIQVVQVWVDPGWRDAWRDERLLAYLERRGKEGIAGIIRFDSEHAIVVFPPCMMVTGAWYERESLMTR